ncbi:MAG: hypothetical protein HGA45_13595 [Chloroflexales bacterium]|nr:hypothetical protein [Chloroflexales bacterium]
MNWSNRLRQLLRESNAQWAEKQGLVPYFSRGTPATALFQASIDRAYHGNFHPSSWKSIQENEAWRDRLDKVHPQRRLLPHPQSESALELDSSNSSDALLMNCFCYPGAGKVICEQLIPGLQFHTPEFGFKACVPIQGDKGDKTEIDMKIGDHLFEAKLTEANFTSSKKGKVEKYRDFGRVFRVSALPQDQELYCGYQLIRNVLAAAYLDASFTVLLDQRRPDLLQEWWQICRAISDISIRMRCNILTWQQIASVCPAPLKMFLQGKYGL